MHNNYNLPLSLEMICFSADFCFQRGLAEHDAVDMFLELALFLDFDYYEDEERDADINSVRERYREQDKSRFVQTQNPKSGQWIKIDREKGKIVGRKSTRYKNLPFVQRGKLHEQRQKKQKVKA